MTAAKKPRVHHHLSREVIARAALDLVDREGADALSLRRTADSLGVGVMNLYTYVDDRDSVVSDVVALLLAEIELPEDPDIPWEEFVVTVGRSLRAMALRHPHAFPFVALAPYDEKPLVRYARRVERAFVQCGFPQELLSKIGSVLDAHGTGFLLLETQAAVARSAPQVRGPFDDEPDESALMSSFADPDAAFEEGMRTIITGFKVRNELPDAPSASGKKP